MNHYNGELDYFNVKETFESLESETENRGNGNYEAARQKFLKKLGQHKTNWRATSRVEDLHVDISKLHEENKHEYIAFMRILSNGYRKKTEVPGYMAISFHLLIGRAILVTGKRKRIMARGSHAFIPSETTFAIRCVGHDQPAIFVFKMLVYKY